MQPPRRDAPLGLDLAVLDAAERGLELLHRAAHDLEIVRVDQDGHALALDDPAQGAAGRTRAPARARRPTRRRAPSRPARSPSSTARRSSSRRGDGLLERARSRRRRRARPSAGVERGERLVRDPPCSPPRAAWRAIASASARASASTSMTASACVGRRHRRLDRRLQRLEVELGDDAHTRPARPRRPATAGDDDRAGLLEAAHDADDAALRLLDDALALRRLEVDLLLAAARRHARTCSRRSAADVLVRHAAKGDREVLLVDLLEHHLDRAVVELDDVLEREQQQADLLGELAVGLGQLVEHVALGRPVGAVEDVGQRLDATGGRVLLRRRRRTAATA